MRGKILSASRRAFAQRGYHGATMRQIAKEAGCDIALVSHYFENKRTLFSVAVRQHLTVGDVYSTRPELSKRNLRGTAELVVRFFEDTHFQEPSVAILRSVLTPSMMDDDFRMLLLPTLHDAIKALLAPFSNEEDYEVIAAELLRVCFARYIARLGPLAELETEEFTDYLESRFVNVFGEFADTRDILVAPVPGESASPREAIAAVSFAAFTSGCYIGVPLRYIAQEVGCDVALIPYYFGSKANLYVKVVGEALRGLPLFGGEGGWTDASALALRSLMLTASSGMAVPEPIRRFVCSRLKDVLAANDDETARALHAACRSILAGSGVGGGLSEARQGLEDAAPGSHQ